MRGQCLRDVTFGFVDNMVASNKLFYVCHELSANALDDDERVYHVTGTPPICITPRFGKLNLPKLRQRWPAV